MSAASANIVDMQAVRSAIHNLIGASIALSILGVRSAYGSVFGEGESS